MARSRVVVLGAGFGGLEFVTRLSDALGDEVAITLIDRSPYFIFGFSKIDMMFGAKTPAEVRHHYRDISKPSVDFRQEEVRSIDPAARIVVTDAGTYEADVLVVALGADVRPDLTPGLVEVGHEFYSNEGAEKLRDVLPSVSSGEVVIGVLGSVFKCPPAPSEAALMLHDYFVKRGVRDAVDIRLVMPLSSPIPISPDASQRLLQAFRKRDIEFISRTTVHHLDPGGAAVLDDGRELNCDLFLGVPHHRAPNVVEEAGLTDNGWIPVDTTTFATRFDGVYAVGDITNAPVPRAGVFAEGQAVTLADHLIAQHRGEEAGPYRGVATCYVEFGDAGVARVDVDFLGGDGPQGKFQAPSHEIGRQKVAFASTRVERWFSGS